MNRVRRVLKIAALVAVFAGLAAGVVLYRALGAPPPGEFLRWTVDPRSYVFGERQSLNLLLLGLDYNRTREGMPYSKGARSDTVLVLNVDRRGSALRLLSIPRDTLVEVEGVPDKLNAAYAVGGAEGARQAVKRLLGVPIDHVVVVRVAAAKEMVDALGGLTLAVEKDMDYDDNWGDVHIHLKQGEQRLDGEQVVGYSRFRNDEEGDLGRIRRQQQVMQALVARLKGVGLLKAPQLVEIFGRHVDTDMTSRKILGLARLYGSRPRLLKATLPADPGEYDGLSVMIPREEEVRALASRHLRSPDELRPEEVRVEVLNGSGVSGAAAEVAETLRREGFQVVRVGNHAASPRTRLVDRLGSLPIRTRVLSKVPRADLEEPKAVREGEADLTLVLGN